MTKYILHGGVTSEASIFNKDFFEEITKSCKNQAKILFVYFATIGNWKELFNDDQRKFLSTSTNKSLKFILANKNLATFKKQIKSADAIYIRGGNDYLLKKRLSKIENLSSLLVNKVVAGSSAGANLLAKYYYSTDRNRVEEGFGFLPIKIFCHYSSQDTAKLKQLKKHAENLKIYKIPETRYSVILET